VAKISGFVNPCTTGLGNVRAKHLNVTREHFQQAEKALKMPLKMLLFK